MTATAPGAARVGAGSMRLERTDPSANLDILRTMAVLFVVLSHLLGRWVRIEGYHLQALGLLGVLLFFVHTCFVLMRSLERQEQTSGSRRLALGFLARRVWRVYPLSVSVVLALAIGAVARGAVPSARGLLSNLLLVQNLTSVASTPSALWSLPYEMQMYLFLPLVYVIARAKSSRAVATIIGLWSGAIIATVLLKQWVGPYGLVKYVPCFLPGAIAYAMSPRNRTLSWATVPIGVTVIAVIYPIAVGRGIPEHLLAWPICLGLGLVLPLVREPEHGPLTRLCAVAVKYSYGIYLLHGPVANLAFGAGRGLPLLAQGAIFCVALGALCVAAYRWIEAPGIAVGRRWAARLVRSA